MHAAICSGVHPKASCEALIHLGGLGLRARLRVQFGSAGSLGPLGAGGAVARFARASVLARFSTVSQTYMHTSIHPSVPTPIQPYIHPYIPLSGADEYLHQYTCIQAAEKIHMTHLGKYVSRHTSIHFSSQASVHHRPIQPSVHTCIESCICQVGGALRRLQAAFNKNVGPQ